MNAPEHFVEWMNGHIANDNKFGRKIFRYHPRSDEHSKKICHLVIADLLKGCDLLREHAQKRLVVGGVNTGVEFPNGKHKTLDLGIGAPAEVLVPADTPDLLRNEIHSLRIACEAKQCMTEHSKTQPRIFDELSSSHEIVHQGDTHAIAAGIVILNIASDYASPTRQTSGDGPLNMTKHRQPYVTERMVTHLRGLRMRERIGDVGFDAFAIIIIDCDNIGPCRLHTDLPAPQLGDPYHYQTFLSRITSAYAERFPQR